MKLHFKSPGDAPGFYPVVERGKGLKYLSFSVLELGGSLKEYTLQSGDDELSLDFYTGPVGIEIENASGRWTTQISERKSIADSAPMVYVPASSKVKLKSLNGAARITIGGAEGKPGVSAAKVEGSEIMVNHVGKDNWTRSVYTHIANNIQAAHLICGETVNRPGGWSSCPPHKHDVFNAPQEVPMEEVYYFQLEPKQGFGFMRVYSRQDDPEPFDNAYAVEHGDTVLIPRGYHPVVACPGYTLNYTWVLGGEGRTYGAWSDDPKHTWIKNS